MKRFLFTLFFSLFGFVTLVSGAALNFTPTITLTAVSASSVRIQIAGCRATGIDTIKVYSAGDDSATAQKYWFKAAVTKDTTVAWTPSIAPRTTLIWKVRADSSGTYKTSAPDTVQTQPTLIVPPLVNDIKDDFRTATNAASRANYAVSTFTIADAAGLDSTVVFETWPYNGLHLKATGDSTKVRLRIWGGNSNMTAAMYHPTPTTALWQYAVCDSLDVSAAGSYVWSPDISVGARYFYVEILGQTDNGHATSLAINVRRYRF